jgi:ABC-type uncharacterized transport system permease subunit
MEVLIAVLVMSAAGIFVEAIARRDTEEGRMATVAGLVTIMAAGIALLVKFYREEGLKITFIALLAGLWVMVTGVYAVVRRMFMRQ